MSPRITDRSFGYRLRRWGVFGALLLLCALFWFAVIKAAAGEGEAPASVITIVQCNKIVAVIFVAVDGSLHPVPLGSVPVETVTRIIAGVPKDGQHSLQATVRCTDETI